MGMVWESIHHVSHIEWTWKGRAQLQVKLNTVEQICLQRIESPLTVKHSILADLIMNWLRTGRIDYNECSQAFPVFRRTSTSVYYCQQNLKSEKWDRAGNEARFLGRMCTCLVPRPHPAFPHLQWKPGWGIATKSWPGMRLGLYCRCNTCSIVSTFPCLLMKKCCGLRGEAWIEGGGWTEFEPW